MVGFQTSMVGSRHNQRLANSIGCFIRVLPIKATLNKSVTFCLLVNRVGEELAAGQHHATLPTSQMLEGKQSVCQATLSLVPLASQCCSGFAAQEVLREVRLAWILSTTDTVSETNEAGIHDNGTEPHAANLQSWEVHLLTHNAGLATWSIILQH